MFFGVVIIIVLSTGRFGRGKGGVAASVGWQVTLWDYDMQAPVAVRCFTNCYTLPFAFTFFTISIEDLKNPETELSQFTTPHH